jgi:hypothetical protein
MRGYLPAALLAVLGLSCGSSSGEEVATDVVAFQSYRIGVVAIGKGGQLTEYRTDGSPSTIDGIRVRRVMLPFVESEEGKTWQLTGSGTTPFSTMPRQSVPDSVARCFYGYVCQTSAGDIVDPDSFSDSKLKDFPAVRGASLCDGAFCLVAGKVALRDGARLDVAGSFMDVEAVSWADIGAEVYRSGVAFLRQDGVVVAVGEGPDNLFVKELVGLPPIRKIHRGGVYEDFSGRMWYLGMAPEGWADDILPAGVQRQECRVFVGRKLSLKSVPCVGPTILPALEGMQPELDFGNDYIPVLYALDKEGTLRCWSAPGGPACVKGE